MSLFKRILVPLDGSSRAELILDQVGKILRREDAEVLLLRVVDLPIALHGMEPALHVDIERLRAQQLEEAQRYVGEAARRLADRGARVRGLAAEGPSAETILGRAEREGITLIAMTTHGRSGIPRWILGSVAEKVARASPVPVLIVRSFQTGPSEPLMPAVAEELRFRKILVPTDGSAPAAAALSPAEEFAKLFGAEVLVLHAEYPFVPPGPELATFPIPIPVPANEDPVTEKPAEAFRSAGIPVTRLTEVGDPAGVILDQVRVSKADLLVMATHGRSGLSRWVLGSVAERVLREARIPLLLVRSAKAKA